MDKKLKMKWVKALESGKYRQCRERLAGGGYYCCLGVLRKIEQTVKADGGGSLIPETCGLSSGIQGLLIEMNDGGARTPRKTFKQIAAWIRKHL